MGDTACVMHGFSYASAAPNESIQENAKHALGESISFGRFMTDQSLSWEKWSTFSHKKYVEEAERYAQPGSVAQKKAFFEAHYKKIAVQKAAALLEQQNAAKKAIDNINASETDVVVKIEEAKTKQDDVVKINNEHSSIAVVEDAVSIANSVTQSTKKSRMDSTDRKRSSSKSLRALLNLVPIKEPDRDPISTTTKTESSPKDCSTPFRNLVAASTEGVSSITEPTPQSLRIRNVPTDSSAPGSKTGLKWHILSAICSKSLRTEERAAKRKQKLEEKINANEVQKVELQKTLKEKAGNEFRKLSCSFCFKAQPLLDSYNDGETPRNQIEKAPAIQSRSAELERRNSNKMHGSISVPPPPPPPTCSVKNSLSKNSSKK